MLNTKIILLLLVILMYLFLLILWDFFFVSYYCTLTLFFHKRLYLLLSLTLPLFCTNNNMYRILLHLVPLVNVEHITVKQHAILSYSEMSPHISPAIRKYEFSLFQVYIFLYFLIYHHFAGKLKCGTNNIIKDTLNS